MIVIIYIRVSTKMQEKKFSLAAQEGELTKYAHAQGWRIHAVYRDVDSGGKLDKAGLNSLLDDVEEGKTDVVLVIDQDRLSRLDTLEWEYLKDILRSNDVKIAEPGRITDLKNEDDEFFSDLKNLIAQREKKTIVRRMMRGKKQRMREGKGFGAAPFGYVFDKENKKYEIDEDWAWVIPFIDKLYLDEQLGMMNIAHRLNELSKTPKGGFWNETLVYRRLISKAFHGVMEKKFQNGEVISIEGAYPPVRTKETYDKIQDERERRGVNYGVTSRQRDELHLFRRTLFTCGYCGRKILLTQHGTANTPRYYLKHGRKLKVSDRTVCGISINTMRVEENVRKVIREILADEQTAERYLKIDSREDEVDQLDKSMESLKRKIKKNEIKLDRLLELYLDGEYDKQTLVKKQGDIKNELDIQQKEFNSLQARINLLKSKQWNYEMIHDYFEIAEYFDKDLTAFEQANTFGKLFPKAVLYNDELILVAEISGANVEISVEIEPDPYPGHKTKR